MDVSTLHSWWTVALLVAFVGIVWWAFGRKRARDFDEAARIPLDEDERPGGVRGRESRPGDRDDG